MKYDVYEYTNQGGRDYNEDAVGHVIDAHSGLFVVADGLGGHALGEVASACARDVLLGDFHAGAPDRAAWLQAQITQANTRILEVQKERDTILKSTVVALAIDDDRAVWAHAGDSRLYYLHDDEIAAITEDHSVAYKKYKAGEITREQIATDEDQSSLLRTLGNEARYEPQLTVCEERLAAGDAFLLCSDGAWEYFKDNEVLIDLLKSGTAREWTERLLVRMMDRIGEGNDNLTLLALMLT